MNWFIECFRIITNGMIKKLASAALAALLGISFALLNQPSPAIVIQPELQGTTQPTYGGYGFTQTFKARGVATAVGVDFLFRQSRRGGLITFKLSEVSGGELPAEWREKVLARDSVPAELIPRQGHWIFTFKPVQLKEGKTYAIAIDSNLKPEQMFTLMGKRGLKYPGGRLYQSGAISDTTISFRIYGEPSLKNLYERAVNGPMNSVLPAPIVIWIMLLFLLAGGFLAGEIFFGGADSRVLRGSQEAHPIEP